MMAEDAEYIENLFDSLVGCLALSELILCVAWLGSLDTGKLLEFMGFLHDSNSFSNKLYISGSKAKINVKAPITVINMEAMVNQK